MSDNLASKCSRSIGPTHGTIKLSETSTRTALTLPQIQEWDQICRITHATTTTMYTLFNCDPLDCYKFSTPMGPLLVWTNNLVQLHWKPSYSANLSNIGVSILAPSLIGGHSGSGSHSSHSSSISCRDKMLAFSDMIHEATTRTIFSTIK